MSNLEKAYYEKWQDQVRENKKLKDELEKHQKLDERLKDFEWKYFKYKKYFNPLAKEYKKVFEHLLILNNFLSTIMNIFTKYLLLNPNYNVKLSEEDKKQIIKEIQHILLEYKKLIMPKEYDIISDLDFNTKTPKTTKKEFERKKFIVKKHKN